MSLNRKQKEKEEKSIYYIYLYPYLQRKGVQTTKIESSWRKINKSKENRNPFNGNFKKENFTLNKLSKYTI